MDHEKFKSLLVRDKDWLERLYSIQSLPMRKNVLNSASDKKLDTLIKFLHLLSSGNIKMFKKNFESLQKAQIQFLRKNFEKKTSAHHLLSLEREEKLKILNRLCRVLPFLLYTLFNEN